MKGKLSPNTMFKLLNLFEKKKWDIDEHGDIRKSLYQRYCDRLKYLNSDEQKLFIELSYKFEQIGITDYMEHFLMSFHNMSDELLKSKEKIIISPLTMPYVLKKKNDSKVERTKTKSAEFLYYLLSSHDLRWIDYSPKFEFCESISDIKKHFIEGKSLLLFIDDFIGTGGTAVKCCKAIISEIEKKSKISNIDIGIVSIAALEMGIRKIKSELNINTYCNFIRKRGISDNYNENETKINLQLMLNLEQKLFCPQEYSLGFEKSEGLISFMNKTPNNTFPAFWSETSTKIAPFPRYKNYK